MQKLYDELSDGCPDGKPGPSCQGHVDWLVLQSRSIRMLLEGSEDPRIYADAIPLVDQVELAAEKGTTSEAVQSDVLSAVNGLNRWLLDHVSGVSTPSATTVSTTTRPQTPEAQLNVLVYQRGLTSIATTEASDDVGWTCRILSSPNDLTKAPAQWLVDEVFGNDRRRQWTELGIPMLCPEHVPVLEQAKSGNYERWYQDGKYVVGEEIPPGTYQVTGKVTDCYWERSTKSGEIIDNNFASVASDIKVTIKASDGGFTSQGCGTWKKVG
ncbi:hypothetical protein [Goodfellowiella coeruleoviolacea]|uniref:Uncharacterized protein n=1 Tax=Goodfellowiella coeruleoviolacea TaxID=334858 RepID=A0AAE3GH20_9PSEU|nr:hypothetical protein [Goodfellowiella coeruleoviolacea]MCP2168121.1 hypothetical protein [Goodfellowiella coeruleoviolacea]